MAGQAFRLDGANDYVSVPDSAAWAFGSSAFTLATWVNFDVIRATTLGALPTVLIGQDEGGGSLNKWVFFYDDNGNLAFHINGAPGSVFLTSPSTIFPIVGTWHHFALTRSGSTYTFYADGISLGTQTDSRSVPDANAALTIGQAEGLGFFDGRLDEIQIYDQALSASEIAGLASAVPEPSSLVLWTIGAAAVGIRLIFVRVRRRETT